MSADTHTTRIGIMFNFVPQTGVPGFRVGLADLPGFRIDQNGSVRRAFAGNSSRPGFSYGSYGNSPGPFGLDPVANPYTSVDRNPANTTDVSGLLALATPQWPNPAPPFRRLSGPISSPFSYDGSENPFSPRPSPQSDNGGADSWSPAKDPIVPVADGPDAANDNRSACNRAYANCQTTARARVTNPDEFFPYMKHCKEVYDLCLNRENDPERIGTKGDFFEFPDGGAVIFRRGRPPQYVPSPRGVPPLSPNQGDRFDKGN
jgi:hypothetical protein